MIAHPAKRVKVRGLAKFTAIVRGGIIISNGRDARSTQLRDDALDEPPRVAREGKAHEPHGLFGRKIGLGILLRRRLVHRDRRRTVNLQLEDVRAARMAE